MNERPRVFVSRRIPDEGLEAIADACDADVWQDDLPPPRDELLRRVAGCDGALTLLTDAGLMPGRRVRVRREGARIVVVREGAEEATGVSLPEDVAIHVFADTPA